MPLAGKPMVEWSIAAMRAAEVVRSVVVACPPGHAHDLGGHDLVVIDGGATRAQSVTNALAAVETELVAIHDAARPLVTPELVEGVVEALVADLDADGAIAAVPVTDTIKRVGEGAIEATIDRDRLWAAQTPQVFWVEALRTALDTDVAATDEAMLIEAAGGRILIHPGSPQNIKVTTPLDLKLAEVILKKP